MEAKLIKVGNSRGVIIPSKLLKLIGLKDRVHIDVEENKIVITPAGTNAREGWEKMIKDEVERNGQPEQLMPDFLEDEENRDWGMVNQYDIYWVNLDPTVGSEIKKTRPAVVISPNASNKHLNTVLIAPLTSSIRNFPMRVKVIVDGKVGQAALDQIRCVDKMRMLGSLGELSSKEIKELKSVLKEFLVD